MIKPGIPSTNFLPIELSRVVEPIKQNVEIITGARPGVSEISALSSTATLADVIAKVNQILSRINHSG